jgi:hemolysin activation/secretion protein
MRNKPTSSRLIACCELSYDIRSSVWAHIPVSISIMLVHVWPNLIHKHCLFVAGVCWCATVLAQSGIPDPSPELQRQDRQRQELRQSKEVRPWTPSGTGPRTPPHQQLPIEQPCAQIDRVVLSGVLSSDSLQKALNGIQGDDPPYGRCLGSQGITLLIQRLQQALVAQGHITSHVLVPEQDLNRGELVLQIHEGRLARITPNRSATADETKTALPRWVWAVREGQILNLRDIEQSSDNLQRLPSLKSNIQIEPGELAGTSDLVVSIQAARPLRAGLSADDGGNRSTGKLQGNATLSWDNPMNLGDLFYVTKGQDLGKKDEGPRGSRNQIVHYSVPWGYWLLGVTFSDNEYRQTVYGPYESYLYRGTSDQKEFSLSRVVHRNASSKTTASIKGIERQSNNHIADLEVLVQRRRARVLEVGLQHLHYFEAGTLTVNIAQRQSRSTTGTPEGEGGTGQSTDRARQTTGMLHWAMPLNTDGHAWQYSSQLQWQWAQPPLTPQDRFCIGGRTTVRGFDGQQTLCGDRGQLWRQELATGLPSGVQSSLPLMSGVQVYAALDAGRTTVPEQTAANRLSGLALGMRGSHQVNGALTWQWDAFVAKPQSYPDGFATGKHIKGFSLRAEF